MEFTDYYGLSIKDFIENALREDVGNGDHTSLSTIPESSLGVANVKVKETGIIAGLVLADQILNQVDSTLKVKVLVAEGSQVKPGDIVMNVEGNTRSLLTAERLVLNCMQRMSGIATLTRKFVDELKGTNTKVLDTRKTTPNFRIFEKWAVHLGGGVNHRFGLYDMILIKDNHVDAAGGIENAIERANEYLKQTGKKLKIEIETRSLEEVNRVLKTGKVDRIMLDNFTPALLKEAIELIDKRYETEASGGITIETIRSFAESGVDFISVGALTHSHKSLDISMKIVK
ncbi:MAG: carboxylating nicotinate-nucleotide diphosphorylase [Bacteroidetes bacterium]|nr:carboxylating nicotinate-nucleotide diphosphorylase [Bacteroidota bacterium]MBK7573564.1 carboxylating nicotinate-nucleotide diphosphorylase [Bacteroidota bacterium]